MDLETQKKLNDIALRWGKQIQLLAKQQAPQRSGTLKRSIRRYTRRKNGLIRRIFFRFEKYGIWQEQGIFGQFPAVISKAKGYTKTPFISSSIDQVKEQATQEYAQVFLQGEVQLFGQTITKIEKNNN